MNPRSIIATVVIAAVLPAFAETPAPNSVTPVLADAGSDWNVRFAIYGLAQSLDGDVSVRGIATSVDVPFEDILSNLDYAAMGAFEIGKGRWSFLADLSYAKLSASADTPLGLVADSLDIGFKQFVGNFIVGYEMVRTDELMFGVYGGARVNWMEISLGLGAEERIADKGWTDPIIGGRFQSELGNSFFFRAIGDVGGFGVSSDFTWQAMAGVGYRFNECSSLLLTYRAIGTDYTDGGFTYDVIAHGPLLGLEFHF